MVLMYAMKTIKANPQTLSQLYQLINSNQAARALPLLDQLAIRNPRDTNVLHLTALAHAAMADHQRAIASFERALEIDFRQPEVHNNFANFLKSTGDIARARQHYQHATESAPRFEDGWRNLAILEYEQGNLEDAQRLARKADELAPKRPATLTLLGNIERKREHHDAALGYFDSALSVKPEHLTALYGKAQVYSALEQGERALPLLEKALQLQPRSPEIRYSRAMALLSQNQYSRAEEALSELLTDTPLYLDAHRTLNEIFWQQGKHSEFGQSYRKIPTQLRSDIRVAMAQVEDLLAAGRVEEAEQQLEAGWKSSDDPRIVFLRGRITEAQGNSSDALPFFERAYTGFPEISVAKQFFISLIRACQFERAESEIGRYLQQSPDDQLLWALRGTCWKMLGDDRYRWLTRDNAFIQPFEIPTPRGFSSRTEFLAQLRETLLSMHNLRAQPLNQSVRAGIQTPGRLLHKHDPVIQALRNSLTEVVSSYIAGMPAEDDHPLMRRRSSQFRFSGSWSVLLRGSGHHVSHVHPQGWISSAFYVSVPSASENRGSALQGGDIVFGQSPYELGDADMVEERITPEAGMLVLFPSFTWHGTVPLPATEKGERLTAPFDAVPA